MTIMVNFELKVLYYYILNIKYDLYFSYLNFFLATQVIKIKTWQVLRDKSWLKTSEEVVLKVMQMPALNATEDDLYRHLVKWGRAHVEREDLRAKIDNCLKHIRFCTMDEVVFSRWCCDSTCLTDHEKLKIFLSIAQNDVELLPEGFSKSKHPRRCMENSYEFDWTDYRQHAIITECTVNNQTRPVAVTVAVEPSCYLTGVTLKSLTKKNSGEQVHLTCKVWSESPCKSLVSATFNGTVQDDAETGCLYFPHPVLMEEGVFYTIRVTYMHTDKRLSAMFATDGFLRFLSGWDVDDNEMSACFTFRRVCGEAKTIVDITGVLLTEGLDDV